jgi:putative membrane protein
MSNDLWTVLIVAAVSYFLLGIELIAEGIEEPFGLDSDDLPLDALCLTIERSLQQVYQEGKNDE